jgi:hypothetical protein
MVLTSVQAVSGRHTGQRRCLSVEERASCWRKRFELSLTIKVAHGPELELGICICATACHDIKPHEALNAPIIVSQIQTHVLQMSRPDKEDNFLCIMRELIVN